MPRAYQTVFCGIWDRGAGSNSWYSYKVRLFRFTLAGVLLPGLLAAQSRLSGRVTDENDTPIPQASITVGASKSSESWPATSDPTGAFSILLPSPGDYLVHVQRAGFYELNDRRVHVETFSEVTLLLNPIREVFQSVDVNGTPSPVDPGETSLQRTLTGTEINDIPFASSHTLDNAMKLIPGVVQGANGSLHFNGADDNQVLYLLNGFNVGNPFTGRFSTRLPVEGIRELEYSSGRFSPEYGKGSAGVLEIRTDSGTDQFRYTATNFIPGLETRDGIRVGNATPRFGFSGPIWRGRAWFADNLASVYNPVYINGLPPGENTATGLAGSNLFHTQVNITPKNILFTDFLVNSDIRSRAGLGPLDPPSTTTDHHAYERFVSVKDQIAWGEGMLFEVGYAHNSFYDHSTPYGTSPYVISPNGHGGNYFAASTTRTSRDQLLANVYPRARHFAGTHQLKVGIDLDRLNYSARWDPLESTCRHASLSIL